MAALNALRNQGSPPCASVSPRQLWAEPFAAEPPTVIDVRAARAYELAHVPNAETRPYGDVLPGNPVARTVPGSGLVVVGVTERDGQRSAAQLVEPGESPRVLRGAMQRWDYGLDINEAQLEQWTHEAHALRLIDVRSPAEWEATRIAGTENKPLAQIDDWASASGVSEEVVLIWSIGKRSAWARDTVARQGFARVHNPVGGTTA